MENFTHYILDELKANHKVAIKGFGTFFLKDSTAKVIRNNENILPPAKEIFFHADVHTSDEGFTLSILDKESLAFDEVYQFIQQQVSHWNTLLEHNEDFTIDSIGHFSFDDHKQLSFSGERLDDLSPDYFGLEIISLSPLQKQSAHSSSTEQASDDKLNKAILWTFLVLIPLCGLIGAGLLFATKFSGDKSLNDISVKKGTHSIEDKEEAPEKASEEVPKPIIDTLIDVNKEQALPSSYPN